MGFSSGGKDQPLLPQRDLTSDAYGLPSNSLKPSTEATKRGPANWQWPWALSYKMSPEVNRKGESNIHLQLCLRGVPCQGARKLWMGRGHQGAHLGISTRHGRLPKKDALANCRSFPWQCMRV